MKIEFITGNNDKFIEASQIISNLKQADVNLDEIQSLTSEEIISHKLKEARLYFKSNLVVEDTSLSFDCLNGLPGPFIKWFLKTVGNEGLVKITESFNNNKAVAKATVGYLDEDDNISFFDGSISGQIVKSRGDNGFGWDSIFKPEGMDKTFAEMNLEEKNEISMRKIAFGKLKDFLSLPHSPNAG